MNYTVTVGKTAAKLAILVLVVSVEVEEAAEVVGVVVLVAVNGTPRGRKFRHPSSLLLISQIANWSSVIAAVVVVVTSWET